MALQIGRERCEFEVNNEKPWLGFYFRQYLKLPRGEKKDLYEGLFNESRDKILGLMKSSVGYTRAAINLKLQMQIADITTPAIEAMVDKIMVENPFNMSYVY